MANPQRGEVLITFAGTEYTLTPTYQALVEIERMTGLKIVEIARQLMSGSVGIQDAVAIVTAGMKASGEPAIADKVGEMIFEEGLIKVSPLLVEFLNNALTGGEEAEPGEDKAAETETSHTETSPPSPTQP